MANNPVGGVEINIDLGLEKKADLLLQPKLLGTYTSEGVVKD